jgi:WhiB family redox-sensing transcriptional regulator
MTVGQVARLPRPVYSNYAWQQSGACTEGDPTVFFHPEGERGPSRQLRELKALAVCAGCPVVEPCRRHALTAREPYGVWGGMTESQRNLILASRETGDLLRGDERQAARISA